MLSLCISSLIYVSYMWGAPTRCMPCSRLCMSIIMIMICLICMSACTARPGGSRDRIGARGEHLDKRPRAAGRACCGELPKGQPWVGDAAHLKHLGRGWKPQTFGFTPTSPTCTFRTWPRLSRRRAGDDCNVVCGNRRLKAVAVLAKYSSREVPVA